MMKKLKVKHELFYREQTLGADVVPCDACQVLTRNCSKPSLLVRKCNCLIFRGLGNRIWVMTLVFNISYKDMRVAGRGRSSYSHLVNCLYYKRPSGPGATPEECRGIKEPYGQPSRMVSR